MAGTNINNISFMPEIITITRYFSFAHEQKKFAQTSESTISKICKLVHVALKG